MSSIENTRGDENCDKFLDLLRDFSMNSNFNGFYDSDRYDDSYIDGIDATLDRVLNEVPVEWKKAYTKMFSKLRHASKRDVSLFDEMNNINTCMKYTRVSKILPVCGMCIMRIKDLGKEVHTVLRPDGPWGIPDMYNVYGFVGAGGFASNVENLQQCIALSIITGYNLLDICPFTLFGGTLSWVSKFDEPEFAFEFIDWDTEEVHNSQRKGRWDDCVSGDTYVIVERKDGH